MPGPWTPASEQTQRAPPDASRAGEPVPGIDRATRARWLRGAALAIAAGTLLAALVLVAYQLALARVPQHRAMLERLVRAQTGLDMRFNELTLRWGWHGPEAVFRRVELGEPTASSVLLRAPELVVGFDAWRTMRSGQLQPGRITLVAPDIDLARPAAVARTAVRGSDPTYARLLRRWGGARVDIEGGTLRIADPAGSTSAMSLHVRSASLRRSGAQLSASGLLFLPERMGRTLRVSLQLETDPARPALTGGSARLEGHRLSFAGWREFLGAGSRLGRLVPQTGSGDVAVRLDVQAGRIVEATGEVHASGVSIGAPSWAALPVQGNEASSAGLQLGEVRGQWRAERQGNRWRARVTGLRFGPAADDAPRSSLELVADETGDSARLALDVAPVESLAAVARWLAPYLALGGAELGGTARDVSLVWNARAAPGERLQLTARLEDFAVASASRDFTVSGVGVALTGSETALAADVEADDARLVLAQNPERPLAGLELSGRLAIARREQGWELTTERLVLENELGQLELAGGLRARTPAADPQASLRGTLVRAELAPLVQMFGEPLAARFGPAVTRLAAGRIEEARFELGDAPGMLPAGGESPVFSGRLTLRDAQLAGDERWSPVEGLDAVLEWRGPHVQAAIERARSGPFELEGVRAEWQADADGGLRAAGTASGALHEALAWLQERPALREHVPHVLQDLAARGDARFAFDVSLPADGEVRVRGAPSRPRVRLSTSLGDASVGLGSDLPRLESVRGTLAFEDGRLQRSTLTAEWLGGPARLRLAERRERGRSTLSIDAQGTLEAGRLASLGGFDEGALAGRTAWQGRLSYASDPGGGPASWRARASTALLGVTSGLPEPFAKSADAPALLTLELEAGGADARLRVRLADRVRGGFALQRQSEGDWRVERGALHFGHETPVLPAGPVLSVTGALERLDLPAYLGLWESLRGEAAAPAMQASLTAAELTIAGRTFRDVALQARPGADGAELGVESAALAGEVRWPRDPDRAHPVEVRLSSLRLPPRTGSGDLAAVLTAIGSPLSLSVDTLTWQDRPLGRLTATVRSTDEAVLVDTLRLARPAHAVEASLRCDPQLDGCRMSFELESRDAAATLRDFGFRDEVAAARAAFRGDVRWRSGPAPGWLATLTGQVSLSLNDGTTQVASGPGRTFAMLAVPALVERPAAPADGATQPAGLQGELRFASLDAQFELRDGKASTSALHFDGDAEILLRGHADLLAHAYDFTAWILRGEERLPAAVRRFGATPSVAAAWMRLRELFGEAEAGRSRAVLQLRGTWEAPIVVPAEPENAGEPPPGAAVPRSSSPGDSE